MANVMFKNGYFKTGIKALNSKSLEDAFSSFMSRDSSYRKQFLQSSFAKSLDGYSYLGQKDSLNQYDFDLLHSFVLSRFNPPETFPEEFQDVIEQFWPNLLEIVTTVERNMLNEIGSKVLTDFHNQHIGHMMSANFYPSIPIGNANRLSSHKDVSLFTVFPFGVDGDLQFLIEGEWVSVDVSNEIIAFPGYLIERITGGVIEALEHRVICANDGSTVEERHSFAMFSIPMPDETFELNGASISSEQYFNEYLNLF